MGYKQKQSTPPMERELNYLLVDLCVKWGFCIPPDDQIKISQSDYYSAESFACDVIEAEGMNIEHESKWVKRISCLFRERFGSSEIYSSSFIDRVRGINESWEK